VLVPAALLTETGDDTGSTRIGEMPSPLSPRPSGDTEHTFRQWGLDGASGETHKEHAAHPADGPDLLVDDEPGADDPVPLPRRRSRSAPVLVSDHGRPVGAPGADRRTPADQGSAAHNPAAADTAPQPLPPAQSVPPAEGARSGRSAPQPGAARPAAGAPGNGTVLPRRVRQANLAPQLRAETTQQTARPADEGRERSADEVRDRMAALQRGWQRGRQLADAESDETATSVPRTTPEGNGR
jgi:hypothetical protein